MSFYDDVGAAGGAADDEASILMVRSGTISVSADGDIENGRFEIDDGLSDSYGEQRSCSSLSHVERIKYALDSRCCGRIVSIAAVVACLILSLFLAAGIIYLPMIQQAWELLDRGESIAESINIGEINRDIASLTKSAVQAEEMANALSRIHNKTEFVSDVVYIVDYLCVSLQCDSHAVMNAINQTRTQSILIIESGNRNN